MYVNAGELSEYYESPLKLVPLIKFDGLAIFNSSLINGMKLMIFKILIWHHYYLLMTKRNINLYQSVMVGIGDLKS